MKITIEGFTFDAVSENKPALCIYGEENVGKSRFGCTAPHSEGLVGWLALDKNSKSAVESYKKAHGVNYLLVNKEPFLTHANAVKIAMTESPATTKTLCKDMVKRVWDTGMRLAEHKDIESIVIDDGSILYDWILFSHFGRRNQIESFMRGGPNNDFIEFINAMGGKNLVLICRGTEVWKDTGEVDANGKKKQAPTGLLKPEGFGKIGKFMTAVIELSARRKKPTTDDVKEALKEKYHCKIVTCKGDTLLEGQSLDDYSITGEDITWDNVMTILKLED